MKTVYTAEHKKHAPTQEFAFGKFDLYHEQPSRAEFVLGEVQNRKIGSVISPDSFPLEKILRIQDAGYIDFLQNIYRQWEAEGHEGPAIGCVFNQHSNGRPPQHVEGRIGYYLADTVVCLTETSWQAIEASAHVALTAQKLITSGEPSAFALCRPPGHHATARVGAGYCFLNNAAIAAQSFLDDGCKRVAILDIDYHHGNGTQDIFYDRDDVFFTSLHADPKKDYPYFIGYDDEVGIGKGEGYNKNYALALGTSWTEYKPALEDAIKRISEYSPDAVVISLGVDTFKNDPISQFKIESEDYLKMGEIIAKLNIPSLFVMEGGYDVAEVGINTVNVLAGFKGGPK